MLCLAELANSRCTVNCVCVVSFYRATVYLQDNSTPLFLKVLEYAVRVFQYLSGNVVREIVPKMFSTYMGTRLIANFRDTKGTILSVMTSRNSRTPSDKSYQYGNDRECTTGCLGAAALPVPCDSTRRRQRLPWELRTRPTFVSGSQTACLAH